jgi:CRP/FNR family cyclic AMP-dependent transcriptional regulator
MILFLAIFPWYFPVCKLAFSMTTQKVSSVLKRVSLFSSLNDRQIAELEAICVTKTVPRNTIVINEGDQTDCLYILISGRAYAVRIDESGKQFVINRFGPNDYFGEMSFFDGNARCATVMTKDQCRLMTLPRRAFLKLAAKHPEILWNVNKALLDKLRIATQQIDALAFMDVYSRLARFLSEHQDENHLITEKFTQQELADSVGSSRETVNRIFNELIAGGYLSKEGRQIRINKKLPYKF